MMKSLLSVLLFAALASPPSTASPSPRIAEAVLLASQPPVAAQEVIDRLAFLKKFRKAMGIKATAEMASIVRRHQVTAMITIIEFGEQISLQTSEELETDMNALIRAWKDAFDSEFGMIMYEYFSLMKVQVRAFRGQRIGNFRKILREYDAAIELKNWVNLDAACDRFEQLASGFRDAGDYYYESECWWRVGLGYGSGVRGHDAQIEKAGAAFKKVVEARKRIELEDSIFTRANTFSEQLLGRVKRAEEAEQAAEEVDEAEGFTRHVPGVALGEESRHILEFNMLEDMSKPFRPGYLSPDIAPIWSVLNLGAEGSSANLQSFQDGPQGIRVKGGVQFDIERDGRGDVDVVLTGNLEPVVMTLGEGDSLRQWGFLAKVLGTTEEYQGITLSLEPSDKYLPLYMAPGASMVGDVHGTQIRIIDENMDGYYGSLPVNWGYLGLTEGHLQPEYDTVVIGSSRRALPWSEYQKIGPDWYQILTDKYGTEVVASPAKLETGLLKLAFNGPKPEYLIVQGTGTFEYSYFDVLSAGKKGLEVPVGVYRLAVGELRKGKRIQAMKALILPGRSTPSWTVTVGETTTIELGGPFSFDYLAEDSGETVTVAGNSIAVIGKAGERYERLWNCRVQPEIKFRKTGTKKSSRAEEMKIVIDPDTLTRDGFAVAWFPRDLELRKRRKEDQVELQFAEKKHKLFGTIESDWKPIEN